MRASAGRGSRRAERGGGAGRRARGPLDSSSWRRPDSGTQGGSCGPEEGLARPKGCPSVPRGRGDAGRELSKVGTRREARPGPSRTGERGPVEGPAPRPGRVGLGQRSARGERTCGPRGGTQRAPAPRSPAPASYLGARPCGAAAAAAGRLRVRSGAAAPRTPELLPPPRPRPSPPVPARRRAPRSAPPPGPAPPGKVTAAPSGPPPGEHRLLPGTP